MVLKYIIINRSLAPINTECPGHWQEDTKDPAENPRGLGLQALLGTYQTISAMGATV